VLAVVANVSNGVMRLTLVSQIATVGGVVLFVVNLLGLRVAVMVEDNLGQRVGEPATVNRLPHRYFVTFGVVLLILLVLLLEHLQIVSGG
jgi:hypothetical protein